jgi:hypothetical protein
LIWSVSGTGSLPVHAFRFINAAGATINPTVSRRTSGGPLACRPHHYVSGYLAAVMRAATTVTGHLLYLDGGAHFGRW